MSTRRITLTLPEELLTEAELAVAAGRARSVSAYVAERAGASQARYRSFEDVLNAWEKKDDRPPTPQQRAEVDEWVSNVMERLEERDASRTGRTPTRAPRDAGSPE